jgi:hypothetical protein
MFRSNSLTLAGLSVAFVALTLAGPAAAGVSASPGAPLGSPVYTTGVLPLFSSTFSSVLAQQTGGESFSYTSGGLDVVAGGGVDPSVSLTASGITPVCGVGVSCVNHFGATVTYQIQVTAAPGAPTPPGGIPLDVNGDLTVDDGYLNSSSSGGYHPSTAKIGLCDTAASSCFDTGASITYTLQGSDYFSVDATGAVPPPPPVYPLVAPQVSASATSYAVQPGDIIDVTLSATVTIYNANDFSIATVDPTISIDPSFASVDPNYPADFRLFSSFSAPAPEPATWSLMLVGAAIVGGRLRRQVASRA